MEKFYIVPVGTKLHEDFLKWKKFDKTIIEIAKKFMERNGIESDRFVPGREYFGIVPTKSDLEKFESQFKKSNGEVRFFKKNSLVNKDWLKETEQVEFYHKPFVSLHFKNTLGQLKSRLFEIDGVVYCSLECEVGDFAPREDFKEIKASEFWRAIEELEERLNK